MFDEHDSLSDQVLAHRLGEEHLSNNINVEQAVDTRARKSAGCPPGGAMCTSKHVGHEHMGTIC